MGAFGGKGHNVSDPECRRSQDVDVELVARLHGDGETKGCDPALSSQTWKSIDFWLEGMQKDTTRRSVASCATHPVTSRTAQRQVRRTRFAAEVMDIRDPSSLTRWLPSARHFKVGEGRAACRLPASSAPPVRPSSSRLPTPSQPSSGWTQWRLTATSEGSARSKSLTVGEHGDFVPPESSACVAELDKWLERARFPLDRPLCHLCLIE